MTTREVFDLVAEGREHDFYCSSVWHHKRDEILQRDRHECQICKSRGKYKRADLVHHVLHLKDRPDLALVDTYPGEDGQEHRQLISVCKECHETVCHPQRMRKEGKEKFTTEERWD